jgi:hypothetical protein
MIGAKTTYYKQKTEQMPDKNNKMSEFNIPILYPILLPIAGSIFHGDLAFSSS